MSASPSLPQGTHSPLTLPNLRPHTHSAARYPAQPAPTHVHRSKDVIEPVLKPQWWVNCGGMAAAAAGAVRDGSLEIIPKEMEATWFRCVRVFRGGMDAPVSPCACPCGALLWLTVAGHDKRTTALRECDAGGWTTFATGASAGSCGGGTAFRRTMWCSKVGACVGQGHRGCVVSIW
jgi:hypothetical protein